MASLAASGDSGASAAPWVSTGPGRALQVKTGPGELTQCVGAGRGHGDPASQARWDGAVTSIFRVNSESTEALEARAEALLGAELLLDGDHLTQVVGVWAGEHPCATEEAEALEPAEDKPEEEQRTEAGTGGTVAWRTRQALEALEALQFQLSSERARASRAYIRVRRKTAQRRKPIVERRRAIIQCIPSFWSKAVSLTMPSWLDRETEDRGSGRSSLAKVKVRLQREQPAIRGDTKLGKCEAVSQCLGQKGPAPGTTATDHVLEGSIFLGNLKILHFLLYHLGPSPPKIFLAPSSSVGKHSWSLTKYKLNNSSTLPQKHLKTK